MAYRLRCADDAVVRGGDREALGFEVTSAPWLGNGGDRRAGWIARGSLRSGGYTEPDRRAGQARPRCKPSRLSIAVTIPLAFSVARGGAGQTGPTRRSRV